MHTCDWESRSPELSSSAILHLERANKVLESVLRDCLITSSTSLSRLVYLFVRHADRYHLQRVIVQTDRHLLNPTVVNKEESLYILFSQIMAYILCMIICADMILIYNLLQCLICIVMIDLSSTCDCTAVLIYKSLIIFISYFCIKIKLKVLYYYL
jgi:hypothetical protein